MYANKKKAHFSYQEACLLLLFYSKVGISYLLLMAYSHSGGGVFPDPQNPLNGILHIINPYFTVLTFILKTVAAKLQHF